MTNLEKMNELVGTNASKKEIHGWAYMNRIWVCGLYDDEEFSQMETSVNHFIDNNAYSADEHENWDRFLDASFVEVV